MLSLQSRRGEALTSTDVAYTSAYLRPCKTDDEAAHCCEHTNEGDDSLFGPGLGRLRWRRMPGSVSGLEEPEIGLAIAT
jgi:hypothetical protein